MITANDIKKSLVEKFDAVYCTVNEDKHHTVTIKIAAPIFSGADNAARERMVAGFLLEHYPWIGRVRLKAVGDKEFYQAYNKPTFMGL